MSYVVPLAGTWIETRLSLPQRKRHTVVPLAGTWIETAIGTSLMPASVVVPLAGTWIETPRSSEPIVMKQRRSPRGNVD